jgi:hypothetical protein
MADQKVSDLPSLNGADVDAADLLYIVDSSAGLAGSKKISVGQYQVAPYSGAVINGVPYFDSNRVLSTSAALTFDGTTLSLGSLSLGSALPIASGGTGSTSTTYCSLATNVTGTLPVANGGTGAATLASNNVLLGNGASAVQTIAPSTSGNVLTSNGTTWASTALPASALGANAQVFTSNGTFTIPTGITRLKVTVVGGGGGGSGFQNVCSVEVGGIAGAGAGTAVKFLTSLTPGNTLSVTVGAGGAGSATNNTSGSAGGNSTVASGTQAISTITGNGGNGGVYSAGPTRGGSASGGDVNINGGDSFGNGVSGCSMFSNPQTSYTNTTGTANVYGGGAPGRSGTVNGNGGAGAAGVVIFEW